MILKVILFNILAIQATYARFYKDRKLLVKRFGNEIISQRSLFDYQTNIRRQFLQELYNLSKSEKEYLTVIAALEYECNQQKAFRMWSYIEYFQTGKRNNYESIIFSNVRRLSVLIIGHLLEAIQKPKTNLYMDDIFSETYRILELTTWVWPAHANKELTKNYDYVDLGAAEIAKQMAWTKLLMGEKFSEIDYGIINARIDEELKQRIFLSYLNRYHFWLGLSKPQAWVNNWNSWINANVLKSAFLTLNDEFMANRIFNRSLYSVDVFINNYGDDGACVEGPAYWREASGRFSEYLEAISDMLPNAREYFKTLDLLKQIGDFSWKMRINDNWFVNLGDSVPEIVYPPWYVWNFAEIFDDQVMRQYAAFMLGHNVSGHLMYSQPLENFKDLNDLVSYIRIKTQLQATQPNAPQPEAVLLDDAQIIIGRSRPEFVGSKSIFVAAQMGTNFWGHSHNDIGNFILFQGGLPVLIDIGVGVYTSKTFGPQRYDLFYMQSRYHNCPTINGYMQRTGYRSNNVQLSNSSDEIHIQGNIESAYPRQAKIRSYYRSLRFDFKHNRLVMNDSYKLERYLKPTALNFVTPWNMNVIETSYGLHLNNSNGVDMQMHFQWSQFDMESEFRSFDNDSRLERIWGDGIKHFVLSTKPDQRLLENEFSIVFNTR